MHIAKEIITPAIAEHWLNNHNNRNRKLREGIAEKYCEDMQAGKWTVCIDPIAFFDDGNLVNGQHRLYAVCISGKPQEFIIARGVPNDAALNIDSGFNRTIIDNGRISGLDVGLTYALVAVCRGVEAGISGGKMTNSQKLEVVDKHREAGEWAISNGPRAKNISNAPVLAAIARAWYHLSKDDRLKLARYCDVLGTGFSASESESSAVAMRNYLLKESVNATASTMWRDTFLRVQHTINAFLEGKNMKVLKPVTIETYPLLKARTVKPKNR